MKVENKKNIRVRVIARIPEKTKNELLNHRLNNQRIGYRIACLRESFGYSQTEFAQIIHTTAGYLVKVEYGIVRPTKKLLCEIAYHLYMSFDELIQFCISSSEQVEKLLSYGEKIKYYREKEGLTQDELGLSIGLSGTDIDLLECEERYPEYEVMQKIAYVLNRSCLDLYSTKKQD